ncbi:aminotransferase class V-fold PLP-dependent enzyme [Alkaliphilus serpentinus]|uniref:Aminotransferase class V-fold PLP-dependent enzyme n=1 Tax=Alkaliphilus serpentinus TaxID=1482731 RepID=A0A833M7R5_9FIRM|nr:aminotransferase class V-fold PLP-dependent enzyme [Alkaliphilus serpentinus]KAB3531148.1 aminotransferase class V-fold PLP-dependent enzyme [Alkaliphilus serpentinus]
MKRDYIPQFYRSLVMGADTKIQLPKGRFVTAINFDNAATTPPLKSVLKEVNDFAPWYSSIHRGTGYKSQFSSHIYESSRNLILEFVNGDSSLYTVIYVKNTTEGINKIAYSVFNDYDVILCSSMEHHSNDLPWRKNNRIEYVEVDEVGRLKLDDLEGKLKRYKANKKLVAVSGASNVTGVINPLNIIGDLCYTYNSKLLVDGAQLVPHETVDINLPSSKGRIDFLVFSGHKMYAPFGTGIIIGRRDLFKEPPLITGGGAVDLVTHHYIKWTGLPGVEEAGTPNLMGVVALSSAIKTLKSISMKEIVNHEKALTDYTLQRLSIIEGVELYGPKSDSSNRVAIIPFNIQGLPHEVTAKILSYEGGIAVRSGCFCAHPYVQRLLEIPTAEMERRIQYPHMPHPGMVRISFGFYNTHREVDQLTEMIHKIAENKGYYYNLYKDAEDLYFPSH